MLDSVTIRRRHRGNPSCELKPATRRIAAWTASLICLAQFLVPASAAGALDAEPCVVHVGRVFAVEIYDFDSDGFLDLLVSDYVNGHGVLYGRATRTFGEMQLLHVTRHTGESGHGAALGDLNGDGLVDAFLVYNQSREHVLHNDGVGNLVDTGQQLFAGSLWGTSVSLADCDGDGDLDSFVTYYQHGVELFVNDGEGQFSASNRTLGADFISLTPGDIDGDSDIDLVGRVDANTVCVVENALGTYVQRDPLHAPGCRRVLFFEANGDAQLDLLIVGDEGSTIWLGNGDGDFSRTAQTLGNASKAAVGDVDCDGDQDLAIGASIWLNDGAGGFKLNQSFETELLISVSLLDLDGDQAPELILSSIDLESGLGPLEIYWNVGD